jgi:deferrochelatase/peroxidase EfeB
VNASLALKVKRALSRVVSAADRHLDDEGAAMSDLTGKLQDGIHFAKVDGETKRVPGFFALVLLDVNPGKTARDVDHLLQRLWEMYAGLRRGEVPDLGPSVTVPPGDLHVLVGFGRAAFGLDAHTEAYLPGPLENARFRAAVAGNPIALEPMDESLAELRDSGIPYGAEVKTNPGAAAFALQFTASTPLAVERAVVETWKILHDDPDPDPALAIAAVYTGSQRDDGRSWIDFYDGLSNLSPKERESVIPIPEDAEDSWTVGGTYMAFARLGIDLTVWRALTVEQQEGLVGRAKLSGCALVDLAPPKSARGCPLNGKFNKPPAASLGEASDTNDATLKISHVQRANHREPSAEDPQSFRIYRQGYPFLESTPTPPGFRAGLNFVSFQGNPWRFIRLIMQDGWLGGTNFAGTDDTPPQVPLLAAYAVGVFLVPPRPEDASFPGRSVLNPDVALVPA